MQSTSAISFAGRTPTCGPATCFGATSLTRPVRPEPPFGADGNVIFRYHLGAPNSEVISYRNFCRTTRGGPVSGWTKVIGCRGRILNSPQVQPKFDFCASTSPSPARGPSRKPPQHTPHPLRANSIRIRQSAAVTPVSASKRREPRSFNHETLSSDHGRGFRQGCRRQGWRLSNIRW